MNDALQLIASIAEIATAVVALGAWGWYQNNLLRKRKRLEQFLKDGRQGPMPYHSIMHLMAGLGMTESEIYQASFRSRHIDRLLTTNDKGIPDKILFKYEQNVNAIRASK